jgi:pimeloyl-ACP methyl ester carboxylesterase
MTAPIPFVGEYADHFFEVDGLKLHYTEWNPRGEQTIVMLHGLNVQLHTWDPIAHDLASDYRVLLLDLRGHGDSDWARDGYHLQQFVSDVRALTEHTNASPFVLVGHSLGARIAIAYAGQHPDDVTHMVLSDNLPEVPREGALAARKIVGSTGDVRGFRTHEEVLARYEELHPEWQPVFRELHAHFMVRRNWADKLVFKADPDLFWITGSVGASETPQLWEYAAAIKAPSLLVAGKRSPFVDEELAERFRQTVPNADVLWTDTDHYIPREAPEVFCKAVRDFIASD